MLHSQHCFNGQRFWRQSWCMCISFSL